MWFRATKNCYDGTIGRLYYRGDRIEDMSESHPFIKNGCFVVEGGQAKPEPVFDEAPLPVQEPAPKPQRAGKWGKP